MKTPSSYPSQTVALKGLCFSVPLPDHWPVNRSVLTEDLGELEAQTFCGHILTTSSEEPDPAQYNKWDEMLLATDQSLHRAVTSAMSAADGIEMRVTQLKRIQSKSIPEERKELKQVKPVYSGSRLCVLSPEYDQVLGLHSSWWTTTQSRESSCCRHQP